MIPRIFSSSGVSLFFIPNILNHLPIFKQGDTRLQFLDLCVLLRLPEYPTDRPVVDEDRVRDPLHVLRLLFVSAVDVGVDLLQREPLLPAVWVLGPDDPRIAEHAADDVVIGQA
ncbi:MAG: hypothetical protein GY722_21775 [bacterium]|nr:hypothetical protein [bacterium]